MSIDSIAKYEVVPTPFPAGFVTNPLAEFCLVCRTAFEAEVLAAFVPGQSTMDAERARRRLAKLAHWLNLGLVSEQSKRRLIGIWEKHSSVKTGGMQT